jgi:hypothetical protein
VLRVPGRWGGVRGERTGMAVNRVRVAVSASVGPRCVGLGDMGRRARSVRPLCGSVGACIWARRLPGLRVCQAGGKGQHVHGRAVTVSQSGACAMSCKGWWRRPVWPMPAVPDVGMAQLKVGQPNQRPRGRCRWGTPVAQAVGVGDSKLHAGMWAFLP